MFATDFWRHRIRRLDPVTLQQTASLDLVLPSRIASQSKYAAFLPNDVAVGQGAVWISTEWCTVARADQQLTRALAAVQLPCDAYQTIAFGAGSLWISESLAGLYRIDAARNRVTARLLLGAGTARLVVTRLLFEHDRVLAIAARTQAGRLTGANALARIDSTSNRVLGITPLPSGQLLAALGKGSLWIGRANGSVVARIDPATGRTLARLRTHLGTALTLADGHLWSARPNGFLSQLRAQ